MLASTNRLELPLYNWKAMPHQHRAWKALRNPDIKTFVLAWHRRAGKDEIALQDTAIRILTRPPEKAASFLHTLPKLNQAVRALWNGVNPKTGRRRIYDVFPKKFIVNEDNVNHVLTFMNGCTWELAGSDNHENLLGTSYVHVVFSEAALCLPDSIAKLRPIIAANNGTCMYISSVRGRNHFYHLYNNALKDDKAFAECLSAEHTGVFTPEQLVEERMSCLALHGDALGDLTFRQEYLSDWDSAAVGAIFSKEIADIYAENRAIPLTYDNRYPVYTFWDLGVNHPTVILFAQEVGNRIHLIDWYAGTHLGLSHYAQVIRSKPYKHMIHFAPHDIANMEFSTGTTRYDEALSHGIKFEVLPRLPKAEQIASASSMCSRLFVNVENRPDKNPEDDCEFILHKLSDYRFKINPSTKVYSKVPMQNEATDYGDAFCYMALGMQRKMSSEREEMERGMPLDERGLVSPSFLMRRGFSMGTVLGS